MDAPGEVRSHDLPSRSALLGLLAAALGIRRDEEERLNAFNRHYQFLLCSSGNPRWARDYHTVQMPKEVRKARYFSRREELQDPELLSALISRRDYYTDARWMIAVSATPDAPYSLAQLQASLQHPVFPLYLGRKSHPLALPLAPQLLDGRAPDVLREAYRWYQDQFNTLKLTLPGLQNECWWEGEHDGLTANKILRRRDMPLSRQQWLFGERSVNQGPWLRKGGRVYLSRITLHTSELSPAQLLHLVERGEYVMHQWLWDLFPGSKERQFLYRREELQGAFRFLFSHRNSLPPARFLTCRLAHLRQR